MSTKAERRASKQYHRRVRERRLALKRDPNSTELDFLMNEPLFKMTAYRREMRALRETIRYWKKHPQQLALLTGKAVKRSDS